MKKNLRFVSVAAAALLAVAPVATSVVPTVGANVVSAATEDGSEKNPYTVSADTVYVNNNLKPSDINEAWIESNVKLNNGRITGASGYSIKDKNGNTPTTLEGGQTYTVTTSVALAGLKAKTYYATESTKAQQSSSNGTIGNVTISFKVTVFNQNAAGTPYFTDKNNNQISIVPSASGIAVNPKNPTLSDILNAAEGAVNFYPDSSSSADNSAIITTTSDIANQLKQQNITVNGQNVTLPSGSFNITLTGRNNTNGKTTTVTVPMKGTGASTADTSAPVIKMNSASTTNGQYYQVAQGATFDPLNFVDSNGVRHQFTAQQSSSNPTVATVTATSNPVSTSEAGRFYTVTLTATNMNGKTSTLSYYVVIVGNGSQTIKADTPAYHIYGNNVEKASTSFKAGQTVYVGNETREINKVSYSKVSTTSKADANSGNLWIPTSALTTNSPSTGADTNTETHPVMVDSRAYDKNGNYLGHMYYAYDNIEIVPTVVTINGKTYYKVANKDEYVRVTNITGNKRTLRHNAYIYWSSYRRTPGTGKMYKGQTVTTYGPQMRFKNGKKYYRIEGCRNNNKRYIKAVNFY